MKITAEELEKLASEVEENGFETKDGLIQKVAAATAAFDAISSMQITKEENQDSSKTDEQPEEVEKTASPADFASKLGKGLAQAAGLSLAFALTGRAMDSAEEGYNRYKFNKKSDKIISYAKSENPGLKNVSNQKLKAWLNSAYAVAPTIAKDPVLASTFLSTAHAVGSVDLNTAKTIADIQRNGGKDYSKNYDALSGASSFVGKQLIEI
jgi:hypothetical protein